MISDASSTIIIWTLALMLSVPLLTVGLGEIIDRLRSRESAYLPFFKVLRAFVLPAIVAFILAKYVFDIDAPSLLQSGDSAPDIDVDGGLKIVVDGTTVAELDVPTTSETAPEAANDERFSHRVVYPVILSVLYLSIAYAVFTLLSAIKAESNPKAWENRIPGLFKAVLTGLVFVIPVFMLLDAWGIQVGDFARVVGIAGIAIGFALQDALSSITKGFLLVIDKPFAVGDWIEVDGIKGKVTDISWRSTRLQVAGNDIVVIPNLIISDNSVYNFTAEDISYRDDVTLGFSYNDAPNKVKAILMDVLMDCEDVMKLPKPRIYTVSYDDFSIGYRVYFFIKEYVSAMEQERIRDDILNRVWYAADRGGISIPFPITVEGPPRVFEPDMNAIRDGIYTFLRENRYFSYLGEETLRSLAAAVEVAPFAAGETLFTEGEIARHIGLVRTGRIALTRTHFSDHTKTAHAGPNDIISELALMGKRANPSTATAVQDSEILLFNPDLLTPIIEKNPRFARALNTLIETRMNKAAGDQTPTDAVQP